MTSDVVLSSALRTNLQSLQNTQRLIDDTQLKLATGLKVNSALDNPQNFFSAQNLDNRANDLSRLLDGIGQSIRTIEQADNGIKALTKLVEQAESIATSALEATTSASESTSLTGNVDVSNFTGTGANNRLTFTATKADGTAITLSSSGQIDLTTASTETDVINAINAFTDSDGNQVFQASLTDSNRLQIKTVGQTNFQLEVIDDSTGVSTAGSQNLAAQLGLGQLTQIKDTDATESSVVVTSKSASTVSSVALYKSATEVADRSTALTALVKSDGATRALTLSTDSDADLTATDSLAAADGADKFYINVGVNGVITRQLEVDQTTSVQGLIDKINNDSTLNTQIKASFDETTGQINLTSLTSEVESIEIGASVTDQDISEDSGTASNNTDEAAASIAINFGFGATSTAVTASANADGANQTSNQTASDTSARESIRISGGAGELAQLESDFNTVRSQIDTLVKDSDYRGVNLLNGDNLTTTFDEDRTNTLTTEGADFSSTGLGIDGASFSGRTAIDSSLAQARNALTSVRNFGQSIANDLAIIQTRRDFTESTINTLEAGADDLTVADQNEEGANLLALQTRQQLGVTSLSLASQSQQAVLRLF